MEKTLYKELRRCTSMRKEMPLLVKNDTFQKSFLIYACLIHFYSKNINDLTVQELLEELDLNAFELWKTFQTFIQLDPNLPRQLREHFLDIERQLTLHLIWQKNTIVVQKLASIIARNELEAEQLLNNSNSADLTRGNAANDSVVLDDRGMDDEESKIKPEP